jgi:hypothetical protein
MAESWDDIDDNDILLEEFIDTIVALEKAAPAEDVHDEQGVDAN